MRIAHLVGWYFPDSVGGTEVYVRGLCRRLLAAGHEVLVAAPDAKHTAPERYDDDGVPVFRYQIAATPTRDEANHRVPVRGTEALYRWLDEQRPDVLHVHSFTTGVGLNEIRAAVARRIRVIVTCHLPGMAYMCRSGELMERGSRPCDGVVTPARCATCNLVRIGVPERIAAAAGRVPAGISSTLGALPGRAFTALGMAGSVRDYQRMQRELFSLVDRFVVLNETGRRMLLANGSPADKLVLNRLGVSFTNGESKAAPAIRPTSSLVRFGYVGRLHPTKGLAELMRAVAAIPTAVDFRLEVRGPILDEETRRFAGELIDQCRHDSRVTIGGGIDSADVPAFLAGLDVLLCPSMWFENGPTVALEAMAVGTPVIASRLGNLAEAIVDDVTGKLLPPGDVAKWAAAIADVAGTPPTVDRWRAALPPARTMDDIAVDYLALYAA